MSAFLVSKAVIDYMVAAAIKYGPVDYDGAPVTVRTADIIGRLLWTENLLSLAARYPEDPIDSMEQRGYLFDVPASIDPDAAHTQVRCYAYQTCEHDAWKTGHAKAFCDALSAALDLASARLGRNPVQRERARSNATWGIDTVKYVPSGAVCGLYRGDGGVDGPCVLPSGHGGGCLTRPPKPAKRLNRAEGIAKMQRAKARLALVRNVDYIDRFGDEG